MQINFIKMEGCGNDYVYIDGTAHDIPSEDKPELVRSLSDRHFGIGGDGVIFINRSQIADFEMEMYNADGSRGEMCGNGIRCVGKFVFDNRMTDLTEIAVESFGKIKYLTLYPVNGVVERVKVNMGPAILEASEIPVRFPGKDLRTLEPGDGTLIQNAVVNAPITVDGQTYHVTCVSMGNPHAVLVVDNTDELPLAQIGPKFENHVNFPNRINTEFIQIVDREHIRLRVWERGSGETLACGTGCCAAGVACVLGGLTSDRIFVDVLGGRLEIEWDRTNNNVWMTGPARTVFEGSVDTDAFQGLHIGRN